MSFTAERIDLPIESAEFAVARTGPVNDEYTVRVSAETDALMVYIAGRVVPLADFVREIVRPLL